MSDLLDRQKKRELRGSILRTLAEAYGTSSDVSLATLRHVRRDAGERAITVELQYLLDMGYAIRIQEPRDALDETPPAYWRMTAKGMQVINGDLKDESVEL